MPLAQCFPTRSQQLQAPGWPRGGSEEEARSADADAQNRTGKGKYWLERQQSWGEKKRVTKSRRKESNIREKCMLLAVAGADETMVCLSYWHLVQRLTLLGTRNSSVEDNFSMAWRGGEWFWRWFKHSRVHALMRNLMLPLPWQWKNSRQCHREQWRVAVNTDETLLPGLPLTSCCAARFQGLGTTGLVHTHTLWPLSLSVSDAWEQQ